MNRRSFFYIICISGVFTALAISGDKDARPHLPRQGPNLVPNSTVDSASQWSLFGDAAFDDSTSCTDDGSGSIKLVTPIPTGSKAFSDYIPIEGGKQYTFGYSFKSANGPTYTGAQVSIHSSDKRYLRNLNSGRGGASIDGQWQEFVLSVFVPEEAAFVRVQAYKMENTQPGGIVWADDFYFGEGIGFQKPPATKRSFSGGHVRIDQLGNFEVNRDGVWTPFFPLGMYSDNHRDWTVYSKQGWNTIMWTGAAHQVQQAKDAVSEFNPLGMMAGFQISQYTFPGGWAYNDLNDLKSKLNEIFDKKLDQNLLLYYWDNENNHDQWKVPADAINTIKSIDVDSSGKRLHPIYALQGEFNIARVHAGRGLVDVSGTYLGGSAMATGNSGERRFHELLILDRLDHQVSPAAFAQFNGVDGPGDMRLRLYNSLINGAKAMGYWRDRFHSGSPKLAPGDDPVDQKEWWPDFPNLRREVDKLIPIIREPHWTTWSARTVQKGLVNVGTRHHKGEGYLILVNQSNQDQSVTITLEDFPYPALEVRDYFAENKRTKIRGNSFTIPVSGIGINKGSRVLRIVAAP